MSCRRGHREQRPACERLALDPDPDRVAAGLTEAHDTAWRRTADGMASNPDFRIEHRDGADRVVVSPLDAIEEPPSLVRLRGMVEALLPEAEIADIPLEVHSWTGFLDEDTHISGAPSRPPALRRPCRPCWCPSPATWASRRSWTTTTRR